MRHACFRLLDVVFPSTKIASAVPMTWIQFPSDALARQTERRGPVMIYALVDPRDGRVRYVGKANNGQARLRRHIEKPHQNIGLRSWFEELRAAGETPDMRPLAMVPRQKWERAEKWWIRWFRERGLLLNVQRGGMMRKQGKRSGVPKRDPWASARGSRSERAAAISRRQLGHKVRGHKLGT